MTVNLKGRIDSNNAAQVEKDILTELQGSSGQPVILDAADLQYISSAGLRVILRLKKAHPELRIINVSSEVYEILDMTGFTEMMPVEKAYRVVSVEGCEEIGRGANGTIYRSDQDNVVKVYNNADALADIQHEREVAKLALVLGIPTAISYDVVKVGDSYGSVFELLNARSFSKILANEPEKMDWCAREYVALLKKIHGTRVPDNKLPDMKKTAVGWAEFVKDYLPEEAGKKLLALVEAVPGDDHMIHGDYHTQNVVLVGDEVLLIDMDTLAVGNPVFELASMYNANVGFSELDHSVIMDFQGYDFETSVKFWHKVLAAYMGTDDEKIIRETEDKARIMGYVRLIRRSIRRGGLEDEEKRKEIEWWKSELLELLDRTDSLEVSGNVFRTEARKDNLDKVIAYLDEKLEEADCPMKVQLQLEMAVEEIFVNIASYAYTPGTGDMAMKVEIVKEPLPAAVVTIMDTGVPFNPLAKADPDVTLSAEERKIGGLGIFMVKKAMDDLTYEYRNGQNTLILKKYLP